MFTVDWTFNVGHLVQIAAIVGSWIWLFLAMRADIRVLRHDIHSLEKRQASLHEAFNQLGSILTQVAVQDTRLSMMEKSIDELRHGQGFVRIPKE